MQRGLFQVKGIHQGALALSVSSAPTAASASAYAGHYITQKRSHAEVHLRRLHPAEALLGSQQNVKERKKVKHHLIWLLVFHVSSSRQAAL